jgi:hypothetical protein
VNSEPRVEALVRDFAAAPGPTVARERARMERWSRWFKALMVVEIAVTAVGLGLGLGGQFGANSPTLTGIGYTLAAEAATVFVFDLTASRRARVYLDALRAM